MASPSAEPYTPTHPIRIVSAASLFDGHDAAINVMRRILQASGAEGIHFGHNRNVAWCVTHASGDYQDLFIERLTPGDPPTYEFKGEQRPTEVFNETINVRDGESVPVNIVVTHHGSLIMGSPEDGVGLALRYTATAEPERWAESLLAMLSATNVDTFESAMRPWVDPCNTMMCADVHGNISFQMRGKLPIRSRHNGWIPVPGWDGEHEWTGRVPSFRAAPQHLQLRGEGAGRLGGPG